MKATVLITVAATLLGCGNEAPVSFGPLAVMQTDEGMAARNVGMLVITAECVFLERDGERVLLVWPANETGWLPATAEISFRRANGAIATVRDGQHVELGGGELRTTVDGLNGEKVPRRIDWVAEPDQACLGPARWLVSDVVAN